jgi:hypothetical protein
MIRVQSHICAHCVRLWGDLCWRQIDTLNKQIWHLCKYKWSGQTCFPTCPTPMHFPSRNINYFYLLVFPTHLSSSNFIFFLFFFLTYVCISYDHLRNKEERSVGRWKEHERRQMLGEEKEKEEEQQNLYFFSTSMSLAHLLMWILS